MPPKPPVKQITNLRQIDISKMDIKDLQNIDYQKVFSNVRQKPDIAISIAIAILAIFLCFKIFTKSQSERKTYLSQISELEGKAKIVDELGKAEADLKKYMDALPHKMTENEFINTITDFAVKNNVQIESFSPAQNKSDPLYNLTSISLSASARNFSDVGLFINDIENSGTSIRINSWTANMGPQSGSRRGRDSSNPDDLWINFRIDIALVTFKQ